MEFEIRVKAAVSSAPGAHPFDGVVVRVYLGAQSAVVAQLAHQFDSGKPVPMLQATAPLAWPTVARWLGALGRGR